MTDFTFFIAYNRESITNITLQKRYGVSFVLLSAIVPYLKYV